MVTLGPILRDIEHNSEVIDSQRGRKEQTGPFRIGSLDSHNPNDPHLVLYLKTSKKTVYTSETDMICSICLALIVTGQLNSALDGASEVALR